MPPHVSSIHGYTQDLVIEEEEEREMHGSPFKMTGPCWLIIQQAGIPKEHSLQRSCAVNAFAVVPNLGPIL